MSDTDHADDHRSHDNAKPHYIYAFEEKESGALDSVFAELFRYFEQDIDKVE